MQNITNKQQVTDPFYAYIVSSLSSEIKKASNGTFTNDKCKLLAEDFVSRMNTSDSYQMHKSIQAYARMIVDTSTKT